MPAAVKGDAQVTVLETWPLFADAEGDAKVDEFPDLLHPEQGRLRQVGGGAAARLATLGFVGDRARRLHARSRAS